MNRRQNGFLMGRIGRIVRNAAVVLACYQMGTAVAADQATPVATIEGRVATLPHERLERMGWVVWIGDLPGQFPPPEAHAILGQKGLSFIPHILPVLVGTTIDFPNGDPFGHNVFSISPAKRFNLGLYPKGHVPTVLFDKPGIVAVLCNVHPEMSAYIIVLKSPFFAVPGRDGHFVIRNVPSGNRTVRCWSEDGKIQERKVTLAAGTVLQVDF